MRALSLRIRLVLSTVLILLYVLGAGLAYWVQNGAHRRLEESFHRDLAVLARLPRLRERLRQLDSSTDGYLLSGNSSWLDKREETLVQIREMLRHLEPLLPQTEEREILKRLESRMASYLAEQGQWIERRSSGRLSSAESANILKRDAVFESITESLATMKDANVASLETRLAAVGRASSLTLALILATGMAAAGFVAWFLSRSVTGPVAALQRYAREWSFGKAWELSLPAAGSEVHDLADCLKGMSERLNAQFEKEHELGRLKGRLVGMVSHEFNNALTILGGVAMLLKQTEKPPPTGKRAEYYDILKSHLSSLGLAATNLLDLGRLESGKFVVKRRRTELGRILSEVLQRLEILLQRKGLAVGLEIPEGATVYADPEALALVVTNLLGNAIKYTPAEGKITVAVQREPSGRDWRIQFRDSGIGISEEDQTRIMEGYYRTQQGRRVAKGFGVGLDLVNSLLRAHGSELKIESELGKGSCFSFSLPESEG